MKRPFPVIFSFPLAFCLVLGAFSLQAQQLKLGNNPTQINKAALLELQSWNQGLRLTRVDTGAVNAVINTLTKTQQDSTNGMIVFQVKDSSLYYRTGGVWRKLVIEDSIGIVSLDTLTNRNQYFKLELGSGPSGFTSDPGTGIHTLKIDGASTGVVGVVTEGQQTWDGRKTFKNSIGIDVLHPGSIVFMGGPLAGPIGGSNDTLSENNDSLYWDNMNGRLYTSGLTFTNLRSTTSPVTGGAIGVDAGGNVVRVLPGIQKLNGLTNSTQTFDTARDGTNFVITSDKGSGIHTFHLPDASAIARGVVNTGTQTFAGIKTINSGVANTSGLVFANLDSASAPAVSGTGLIGVDKNGNVVRARVQRSFSYPNATQRPFNTVIGPISSRKDVYVSYSIQLKVSALLSNSVASASLLICPTSSFAPTSTKTVSTVSLGPLSLLGLLGAGSTMAAIQVLSGWIPKGYYVKIVMTTSSSANSVTYISGQEVTMQ